MLSYAHGKGSFMCLTRVLSGCDRVPVSHMTRDCDFLVLLGSVNEYVFCLVMWTRSLTRIQLLYSLTDSYEKNSLALSIVLLSAHFIIDYDYLLLIIQMRFTVSAPVLSRADTDAVDRVAFDETCFGLER